MRRTPRLERRAPRNRRIRCRHHRQPSRTRRTVRGTELTPCPEWILRVENLLAVLFPHLNRALKRLAPRVRFRELNIVDQNDRLEQRHQLRQQIPRPGKPRIRTRPVVDFFGELLIRVALQHCAPLKTILIAKLPELLNLLRRRGNPST